MKKKRNFLTIISSIFGVAAICGLSLFSLLDHKKETQKAEASVDESINLNDNGYVITKSFTEGNAGAGNWSIHDGSLVITYDNSNEEMTIDLYVNTIRVVSTDRTVSNPHIYHNVFSSASNVSVVQYNFNTLYGANSTGEYHLDFYLALIRPNNSPLNSNWIVVDFTSSSLNLTATYTYVYYNSNLYDKYIYNASLYNNSINSYDDGYDDGKEDFFYNYYSVPLNSLTYSYEIDGSEDNEKFSFSYPSRDYHQLDSDKYYLFDLDFNILFKKADLAAKANIDISFKFNSIQYNEYNYLLNDNYLDGFSLVDYSLDYFNSLKYVTLDIGNLHTISSSSNLYYIPLTFRYYYDATYVEEIYNYSFATSSSLGDIEYLYGYYDLFIDFKSSLTTYLRGYDYGYSVGFTYGQQVANYNYQEAFNNGYNSGFESAESFYSSAESTIYNNGYNAGYGEGFAAGEDSVNVGQIAYDNYQEGYVDGLNAGSSRNETVSTIFSGILQVAMVPVNFFLSIFNFEILGINLSAFIRAIFTVVLTIIVLKTVLGKGGGGSDN